MVAGEDGIQLLGREECEGQDAADLGQFNAVGGCDVGEASIGAVGQLLKIAMRPQNQIDQSRIGQRGFADGRW